MNLLEQLREDCKRYQNFEQAPVTYRYQPEDIDVLYFVYGTDPFMLDSTEIIKDFIRKKLKDSICA